MLWSPEFGWTTQQPLLPFSLIHCITTALTVRELGWADQNGTNTTIGKDSHVNNSARPVHCDVFKLNVHTSMANSPNILAQIWTYSLQNINSLIFLLKEKWWDLSGQFIKFSKRQLEHGLLHACVCLRWMQPKAPVTTHYKITVSLCEPFGKPQPKPVLCR